MMDVQTEIDRAQPDFSTVPALIREHGRSRGFERLRDIALERPEALGSDNFLAVLKLVIELDRHALFSEVSEAKVRDRMDRDAWEKFQEYLRGGDATEPEAKTSSKKDKNLKKEGKKRAKGKPKANRTPLRETEGVLGLLRGPDSAGPGYTGPDPGHSKFERAPGGDG